MTWVVSFHKDVFVWLGEVCVYLLVGVIFLSLIRGHYTMSLNAIPKSYEVCPQSCGKHRGSLGWVGIYCSETHTMLYRYVYAHTSLSVRVYLHVCIHVRAHIKRMCVHTPAAPGRCLCAAARGQQTPRSGAAGPGSAVGGGGCRAAPYTAAAAGL